MSYDDTLLAAIQSRATCYEEAALRSIDETIAAGFSRLAKELREYQTQTEADPSYVPPEKVKKDLQ
jgi:hypothetical protein